MQYLPLFADLRTRACLVVGGGVVAERRVRQLLRAGARVTVAAPAMTAQLAEWRREGTIAHEPTGHELPSFDDYWLIIAATGDRAVNGRVASAAERAKRLCNVVDDPERCSFIMPAIIDHDPVTIAVSSSGRSPVVARWIKGIVEATIPAGVGSLAALAGRFRARVKETLSDPTERRRFWQSVLSGKVADLALSGRGEDAERALAAALADWRGQHPDGAEIGEAYIVGAGPGDPELLTLKGRRLLAEADAVLYDRLVNRKILEFARRDADLICVGKTPRKPSITQAQLNRLLIQLVSSGQRVCRLKGGDPMIFGRIGEELEALTNAGLPFQIVPGISAVEGCAAYAGIPLTLRGGAHTVLITTGHTQEHAAADLASFKKGQTLALYMAVANLGAVAAELIANGHSLATPAVVIENGTTDAQRVIRAELADLDGLADKYAVRSPALLLVGESARFADRYGWFKPDVLNASDDGEDTLARAG